MSEVGEVSDGDSVMSTADQSALLACHEASPLETGVNCTFVPRVSVNSP